MKTDVSFIRESIESVRARSAWDRGVKMFALDILDKYNEACYFYEQEGEECPDFCLSSVLNGADSWGTYCYGGMALIYNGDIARALCTPSELRRTNFGEKDPNSRENWMDVQVRAYHQAWDLIRRYI